MGELSERDVEVLGGLREYDNAGKNKRHGILAWIVALMFGDKFSRVPQQK